MKCRVCKEKINGTKLPSFTSFFEPFFSYSFRKNNSRGYFCKHCASISFFQNDLVSYKDGNYRKRDNKNHPPLDLPWSTITYKRHKHVANLIKRHKKAFKKNDALIDFGGYNGLCAYGICQEFGINFKNSYIADMDPHGLKMAKSLGFNTINLSKNSLSKYFNNNLKNISLVTAIHVLEHLDNPEIFFSEIKYLVKPQTLIYIEVPSKNYFPLSDLAHLITFSEQGMIDLASRNGFELIENTNVSTPSEAINFGYSLSSRRESKAFIFKYKYKNRILNFNNRQKNNFHFIFFILRASLNNIFLRLIILRNYLNLFFVLGYRILRNIILMILSIFLSPLYLIKLFVERFK